MIEAAANLTIGGVDFEVMELNEGLETEGHLVGTAVLKQLSETTVSQLLKAWLSLRNTEIGNGYHAVQLKSSSNGIHTIEVRKTK